MKKAFACLLILLQIATVATATYAQEGGTLTYQETTLQIPEGYDVSAMDVGPDGSILAMTWGMEGGQLLLRWSDLAEMPEEIPIAFPDIFINGLSIAGDGGILLSGSEMIQSEGEMMNSKIVFIWIDEAGKETGRIYVENEDSYPTAKALPGRLAAVTDRMNGREILIYDEQGEMIRRIDTVDIREVVTDADTLYGLSDGTVYSWPLDAIATEKAASHTVSWRFFNQSAMGLDGKLYTFNQGIYEINLENGTSVQRMNVLGTLIGETQYSPSGFSVLPDGSFAVLVHNYGAPSSTGQVQSTSDIAIYRQVENAETRTPFVITAMYTFNSSVQRAASQLQKAHPELEVQIRQLNDFMAGGGQPMEDLVRTLNTELMAGGGGDVLILDNMPYKAIMDRGILRDIAHLVPDLGLLPGIAEGSKHADGKVYGIPAEFWVDMLWGKKDALEGIKGFSDIPAVPVGPDQTLLPTTSREYYIWEFMSCCMRDFLDDQGRISFTSPNFVAFLEAIYEMYGGVDSGANQDVMALYDAEQIALANGNFALYPTSLSAFFSVNEFYTHFGQQEAGVILMPSLHGVGKAYQPKTLLGIPAKAKNPEISEEYIRMVFQDEEPAGMSNDTFSTVASKLDAAVAYQVERGSHERMRETRVRYSDGREAIFYTPDEAFLTNMRAQMDELSVAIDADSKLREFVFEELGPFLEGSITAEEAAKAIEQRAWLYLNE